MATKTTSTKREEGKRETKTSRNLRTCLDYVTKSWNFCTLLDKLFRKTTYLLVLSSTNMDVSPSVNGPFRERHLKTTYQMDNKSNSLCTYYNLCWRKDPYLVGDRYYEIEYRTQVKKKKILFEFYLGKIK